MFRYLDSILADTNRTVLWIWRKIHLYAQYYHSTRVLSISYIHYGLRNIWRRFPIFWLVHSGQRASVCVYLCISISPICPAYIWLIVKVVYVCSRSPHACCCLSATRYKEKRKARGKTERQTNKQNVAI